MHKSCPYLEFLWPTFSHVWTEYRDLLSKYPYSVQMQENIGQTNSKYKYFLGSRKRLLAINSNQEAKKDDHQQVDRSSCKQRVGGSTRKKIDITLEKKNKQTKVQPKKLIKCNREIPKYLYHYRHLSSQNQTRLNMEFILAFSKFLKSFLNVYHFKISQGDSRGSRKICFYKLIFLYFQNTN